MSRKENVSTVMLLPILRINKKISNSFYNQGFVNTYLFSELDGEYKFTPLYLLFKPAKFTEEFNRFLYELSTNINFIEIRDVGKGEVLVVFKIPDVHQKDYVLFLQGKYSKLSDQYKKCFPLEKPVKNERGDLKRDLSGGYVMEPTTFFHIFNKTKKLREIYQEKLGLDFELPEDLELYDVYNKDKENLKGIVLI